MPKTYEQSVADNINEFRRLIVKAVSQGANWQPQASWGVGIAELNAIVDEAEAKLATYNAVSPDNKYKINVRQVAFKAIPKRVRLILRAFKMSPGVSAEDVRDMRTLTARVTNVRLTPKPNDNPATPDVDESQNVNSTAHLGYANQLNAVDGIGQMLVSKPSHKPNEAELKTEAVIAWHGELQAIHEAAEASNEPVDNARDSLNETMYTGAGNMYDRYLKIKEYAPTVNGISKEDLKEINKIKLKKPSKFY